ncbi:Uncharacterised protein [Chryseobacterium indologenes]|nr:Uncharacterised protein [Chryseobacterium indologenes]
MDILQLENKITIDYSVVIPSILINSLNKVIKAIHNSAYACKSKS